MEEQAMTMAQETLNEALEGVPTEQIEVCKQVLQVVYDNLR
jgi:hypothetical protein